MPGSKKFKEGSTPAKARSRQLKPERFNAFRQGVNLQEDRVVADRIYVVRGEVNKRGRAATVLAELACIVARAQNDPILGFEARVVPTKENGESGRSVVCFTAPQSVGQEALDAAAFAIIQTIDANANDLPIILPPKTE